MVVGDGFLEFVIMIDLALCFAGLVLLVPVYAIVSRVNNPITRALILALPLVVGYATIIHANPDWIIFASLVLVVPFSTIFASWVFPRSFGKKPAFPRVLICFLIVFFIASLQPFIFTLSVLEMVPAIYWHTPFSNLAVYCCIFIAYAILAVVVFAIMDCVNSVIEGKPQ